MIPAMPRPRPPHLHSEPSRHGQPRWYVRIGRGPRIRIRETYGTPEFDEAYRAALAGETRPKVPQRTAKGSLAWLYERYRDSGAWLALAPATKRQRENIFAHVMAAAGAEPAKAITRQTVAAGLERRKHTPSQARNFLDAMRGLLEWAVEAQHLAVEPTAGLKAPARPRTHGFPKWTEEDAQQYEAYWPLGTRQRVWLAVLLYSGLRRGDAVRYGRQHVRNGIGRIRTEKSKMQIEVTLPILPALQEAIDAGPTGQLTFICGAHGGALTKESFGNMFSEAARQAGINKSAHGVRKLGATRAAENGASEAELDALFGWERGSGTSAVYTREAERSRLSTGAIGKLARG